jgi:hypothetical protein
VNEERLIHPSWFNSNSLASQLADRRHVRPSDDSVRTKRFREDEHDSASVTLGQVQGNAIERCADRVDLPSVELCTSGPRVFFTTQLDVDALLLEEMQLFGDVEWAVSDPLAQRDSERRIILVARAAQDAEQQGEPPHPPNGAALPSERHSARRLDPNKRKLQVIEKNQVSVLQSGDWEMGRSKELNGSAIGTGGPRKTCGESVIGVSDSETGCPPGGKRGTLQHQEPVARRLNPEVEALWSVLDNPTPPTGSHPAQRGVGHFQLRSRLSRAGTTGSA